MGKRVKAKAKGGQEVWIIVPNIEINSFAINPKKVTFLEIFYFFAQALTKTIKKKLTKKEEEKLIGTKKRALIELDNKVTALKFLAKECKKHGKLLLARKDDKKRIYDYKPYQVLLALTESYLNTLHSIYDLITKLDELLGQKFAQDINKEQWFQIDIDLRNVFHHNQSPLLSVEKGEIFFTFERLPRRPKFLKESMKNAHGRYQFTLDCEDLSHDILDFLNKWAKKYIDLIDDKETISLIIGHHKDGRIKSKKVTLKELKKIASAVI